MATLVESCNESFNGAVYGFTSPAQLELFRSVPQETTQRLTDAGRWFVDKAQQTFERIMNADVIRSVNMAARRAATFWQRDEIRPLHKLEELQNAPNKMVRWLMANPELRRLYHRQQIDGYSERYFDCEPGRVGEAHYDYRRVMDGVAVVDDENDSWQIKLYGDSNDPNDELTPIQKTDVLVSWDSALLHLHTKREDVTSKWGALFG